MHRRSICMMCEHCPIQDLAVSLLSSILELILNKSRLIDDCINTEDDCWEL